VKVDTPASSQGEPSAIVFWQTATIVGPLLAFIAPLTLGWLAGVPIDLSLLQRPHSFAQALVSLTALFYPIAAFNEARRQLNLARARCAASWPTTAGTVLKSKVVRRISRYGPYFSLDLTYRYHVGGKTYDASAVQFGPNYFRKEDVPRSWAAKYPAGSSVSVRYDPNDPRTAALETDMGNAHRGFALTMIFLTLPVLVALGWIARSAASSS